jgi:hypothetical protein
MEGMELLAPLIGKKITLYSVQGETERSDVGTLEAAEGHWVRMRKSDGELLFFAIERIRLIKPFDSA